MLGRKKQSGVGHIRPSTQGTSNEISFSVLHAKSNAAAQDQGSPARPAWELPQEELRERRTKRRTKRRLAIAAAVLAGCALVALVATLVVVNVQRQLDHVANMKWMLEQVLDECDQLQPFNEAVNQALVQPIGTTAASQLQSSYDSAQRQKDQHAERLRQLKSQIEADQGHLKLPTDREAANQGIAAATAQLNLLDMGTSAMDLALPAQQAYADAQQAMENILRANDLAREATELVATMNADTAAQSKARSEECLAALQTARGQLESAQQEVQQLQGETDAAIAAYLDYTDLRIQAQQAAINSMQAYLDRDKATLQQANDTYNQLEQQAADLAAQQSLLPSDDVATAFNAARASDADQWSAESARASVALTAVRDYLG